MPPLKKVKTDEVEEYEDLPFILYFVYANDTPLWHDPFHLWLLSFCPTAPRKWKDLNEPPFAFIRQDCDVSNRFCKHHRRLSLSKPFCWYTWGTEIVRVHRILIGFNLGNQGLLAFQSDSRALISHHTYLLLIEFEGRTVRYGPSFFARIYGTSAKCAGKTRFHNLLYGPRKTRLVRYL